MTDRSPCYATVPSPHSREVIHMHLIDGRVDGHTRDFADLTTPASIKSREVVRLCAAEGVVMLVYCTWRSAATQARLYRRSRTTGQVREKAEQLHVEGYTHLADILLQVGPQWGKLGDHRTHAGPGESWHQYGMAIDAVPIVDGKLDWTAGSAQYQVYAQCCRQAGLQHATEWESWQEWPHAQVSTTANPLDELQSGDTQVMALTVGWEDVPA